VPLFEFERVNHVPMVALNGDAKLSHATGDRGQRRFESARVKASRRAVPVGAIFRSAFMTTVASARARAATAVSSTASRPA